MRIPAGRLNRTIRIERPVRDDSFDGAGSGQWAEVVTVRAEVLDALPSRGERLADGINVATRPARVRMRYRDDVTPDMRFVMSERALRVVYGPPEQGQTQPLWRAVTVERLMQIVAGPAEMGSRHGIELMVEDYSVAGNAA